MTALKRLGQGWAASAARGLKNLAKECFAAYRGARVMIPVPAMTAPVAETLPILIDRATAALASARTSGEVLEARDLARVAYDAAKSAARMARAA